MGSLRPAPLALVLAGAALLAAVAPAGASTSDQGACSAAHVTVARNTIDKARDATLCLLNRTRARHGLPPLRLNAKLTAAATKHSRDMVRRRYFSHDSPDGRDMLDRVRAARYVPRNAGYVLGENIGWGSGPLAEPMSLVRAWMRSPGHRRNILDRRFRDIGIGIVVGAPVGGAWQAATYTTNFGRITR